MSLGSVLVTGANRGIGLEFVKQLIALPSSPKHLFVTCRNPDKADVSILSAYYVILILKTVPDKYIEQIFSYFTCVFAINLNAISRVLNCR